MSTSVFYFAVLIISTSVFYFYLQQSRQVDDIAVTALRARLRRCHVAPSKGPFRARPPTVLRAQRGVHLRTQCFD